MAAKAGEI